MLFQELEAQRSTKDDSDDDSDEDDDEVDEGTLDLEATVPPTVEHMRCAAHTLQLSIEGGLKKSGATSHFQGS